VFVCSADPNSVNDEREEVLKNVLRQMLLRTVRAVIRIEAVTEAIERPIT